MQTDSATCRHFAPLISLCWAIALGVVCSPCWAADTLQPLTDNLVSTRQALRWGTDLFFIGGLLMMGFYSFRRTNVATLFFGLYCVCWAINFSSTYGSHSAISLFLPSLPEHLLNRIEMATFLASIPVGYRFFHLRFPLEFPGKYFAPLCGLYGVFVAWACFAPIGLLNEANPFFYLVSFGAILMTLIFLSRAFRAQREGATPFLVGFAILGCIGTNDMLFDLHLINSIYLMPLGMSLFIFAQSNTLSHSLSRAFAAVEKLSGELEDRNQVLNDEIRERARLEAEIVEISENERRQLSYDLHDGLCQQLTAARLYCNVLKNDMLDRAQVEHVAQLEEMLSESVNQAYGLSRGLWPVDLALPGVNAFLADFCDRMAASGGIATKIVQHRRCESCSNAKLVQLYRIGQEAITNSIKHSRGTCITVEFDCVSNADKVTLSVRDDGVGRTSHAPTAGGLGTQLMHHRAQLIDGTLQIRDVAGGGTEVSCTIACAAHGGQSLPGSTPSATAVA